MYQKDFSTTEIKGCVEKNKLLLNIYERSIEIIKNLEISVQNVEYYSKLS